MIKNIEAMLFVFVFYFNLSFFSHTINDETFIIIVSVNEKLKWEANVRKFLIVAGDIFKNVLY